VGCKATRSVVAAGYLFGAISAIAQPAPPPADPQGSAQIVGPRHLLRPAPIAPAAPTNTRQPIGKTGATPAPDNSPSGRARAAVERAAAVPVGTVTPAKGPWGVIARVTGPRFGQAESVRGLWYPNNDTTQAPIVSTSVTFRGRRGLDEIDIQIPLDPARSGASGDFSRGTLHIILLMPHENSALYAATYAVDTTVPLAEQRMPFRPRVIATQPMQLTGTRPPPPKIVVTQPIQLVGTRRPAFVPKVVATEAMQVTGTRPPPPKIVVTQPIQLVGTRRPAFVPKVVATEPMRLTGTRPPPPTSSSDRQLRLAPAGGRKPARSQ
jgi:hypothetical protein